MQNSRCGARKIYAREASGIKNRASAETSCFMASFSLKKAAKASCTRAILLPLRTRRGGDDVESWILDV